MGYCPKGSVWNVIERKSFSMTWHFRMALAVDIAEVFTCKLLRYNLFSAIRVKFS